MFENSKLANHHLLRLLGLVCILFGIAAAVGMLVANQPVVALAVLLIALLGFTMFFEFDIIVLITFALLYTNAVVIAVKFHQFPYIVGAFIVPFLLSISLIQNFFIRRQKLILDQVFWLLLGFLVVQILGTSFSIDVKTAMNNLLVYFTEGLFLYFLIVNVVRTPRTMRWAIWTLLVAGTFIGGLSLYQQVTHTFGNDYWGFAQVGGRGFGTGVQNLQGEVQQSRLEGPIGEKNYYAQIMLMLVPLGLLQFQSERSKLLRWFTVLATSVILVGGLLTFSRGAAVAFVVMLIAMTVLRFIKFHQLILVLLGIYLLFQIFPQYGVRLASLQSVTTITQTDSAGISGTDTSTQGRIGEMLAAWEVFLDHPIIGVGPGMFNYYYPEYAERVGLKSHTTTRAAHDLYLGIAANHGILGVLLFFSVIAIVLRNLWSVLKRYRLVDPDLANMAAGLMLALIAFLGTGLFLSLAYERYLWLIIGLAGAVYHISNNASFQEKELVVKTEEP